MSDYLRHIIQRNLDMDTKAPATLVMPRLASTYEPGAAGVDPSDWPAGHAPFPVGEPSTHQPAATAQQDAPLSRQATFGIRSVRDPAAATETGASDSIPTTAGERHTAGTTMVEVPRTGLLKSRANNALQVDEKTISPIRKTRPASRPAPAESQRPAPSELDGASRAPPVGLNTVVPEHDIPHGSQPPRATSGSSTDEGRDAEAERQESPGPLLDNTAPSPLAQATRQADPAAINPADNKRFSQGRRSDTNAGWQKATSLSRLPAEPRQADQNGVTINIDRIEIRAVHPPVAKAQTPRPQRQTPKLSLEEYLKQRNGGGVE